MTTRRPCQHLTGRHEPLPVYVSSTEAAMQLPFNLDATRSDAQQRDPQLTRPSVRVDRRADLDLAVAYADVDVAIRCREWHVLEEAQLLHGDIIHPLERCTNWSNYSLTHPGSRTDTSDKQRAWRMSQKWGLTGSGERCSKRVPA